MPTPQQIAFAKAFCAGLPEDVRTDPAKVAVHVKRAAGIIDGLTNAATTIGPLGVAGLIAAPPVIGAGLGLAAAKVRSELDPVIPRSSDIDVAQVQTDEMVDRLRTLATQARVAAAGRRSRSTVRR